MIWLGAALVWAAVINAATYLSFAVDKRRARNGGWRIPEATLLNLALLGGWPAAKLAQRRLRHKTRKHPFVGQLTVAAGLNVAAVVAGLAMIFSPALREAAASALGDIAGEEVRHEQTDPKPSLPKRFGPGS